MVKNNYFVDFHDKVSGIRHKSVKHRCRFIVSNVLCKKTIQKKIYCGCQSLLSNPA